MPPKKHKRSAPARKTARVRGGFSGGGLGSLLALMQQGATPTDFTMKDEARNTASHQPAWGRDARLRHQPVAFINAGLAEPPKDVPSVLANAQQSSTPTPAPGISPTPHEVDITRVAPELMHADSIVKGLPVRGAECTVPDDNALGEMLDFSATTNHDQLDATSSAQAGFFFDTTGDKSLSKRGCSTDKLNKTNDMSAEDSDSSEDVILFKGRLNMAKTKAQQNTRTTQSQFAAAIPVSEAKGRRLSPTNANAGICESSVRYSPGEDLRMPPSNRNTKTASPRSGTPMRKTASQLEEEDLIADYIANIAQDSDDDGETHHAFSLSRDLGGDHNAFHNESDRTSNNDPAQSGTDEPDESDEQNADEHNESDDEALALLLAKQEELGLGSNELLLFSDSYTKVGGRHKATSVSSRKASRVSQVLRGSFPTATAVAEAFDNLELTDWNQAAGRRSDKSRNRHSLNFDLSDSELEAELHKAWHNDRERKKSRKMEREELRAKGLLGRKVDPEDMRVKYRDGMTLDNIKEELKTFLLGSEQTLQFPPMDKQARKMLHELANKFKIKSHSTGNGDQRRPILARGKQTTIYALDQANQATLHIEAASARVHRKYFPRVDTHGKQGYGFKDGGRSSTKAATYRDGEIVGAAVPELGQENKGRAMLEKMGWTKGMALGATENQGILEPVVQVVKNSKAGLG